MKTMKRIIATLAASTVLLMAADTFAAGTTHSYTMTKKSYSGSRDRQYKVYVPNNLPSGARPMVMALHGCSINHDDVLNDWGLKANADANGYILVAPFITTYDGMRNTNCWGFWFDQHQKEGAGEPEDLHSIAVEVESNFNIDPDRRFITGLSSGGAMTVVAAVTHNEYWAAAAPAAGIPYSEDSSSVSLSGQCPGNATFHSISTVIQDIKTGSDDTYQIPVLVFQNNNDCTVVQPAGSNIAASFIGAFGGSGFTSANTTKASEAACSPYNSNNYSCKHIKYTQDGTTSSRSLAETVFYNGPHNTANSADTDHGHYWIGGSNGNEGKWAVKTGPSYPDIMWDFFNRHPRSGTAGAPPTGQGKPQITMAGDNPMTVNKNASFSDPGASATDQEDGTLTVSADCNVNTAAVGEYRCIYGASDSDDNVTSVIRIVNVIDPSAPTASCTSVTGTANQHLSAGRAVLGGILDSEIHAKNDGVKIGPAGLPGDYFSATLYEGKSGEWFTAEPAICREPAANTAPVVTVTGSTSMTLTVGDTYTEQGATATDAEDGSLTSSIQTSGSVNTAVAGTYTITYSVTDSGSLSDSETRTVVVEAAGPACFTSTNSAHVTAGRAYTSYTLYYATGTATYLGLSYSTTSLQENTTGVWTKVTSCP